VTPPLVLLHGFTGAPASWDAVRGRLPGTPILAPTMLGHGGAEDGPAGGAERTAGAPTAAVRTFDDEVDRLALVVRDAGLDRPHLVGYSMGGRVALGLVVRHPGLFRGATLIGASPGLADPAEREARRRRDEEWARLLETEGLDTFVAAWGALPLFESQGRADAGALERQDRIRRAHNPLGLARSLRVVGLGAMPDYRRALEAIDLPVRVVAGADDMKFRALGQEMVEALRYGELHLIPETGHNVVLERPAEIERLLKELET
jgi:2-succinyl-6-hydroxy-2,4-cyclohexadiene-1-carboxylate synthase